MSTVTLIGIDLGKHSFHLHGQDATGRMVFRKKCSRQQLFALLSNTPRSTVVMEACAGAHWMARRIQAQGHQAKLISPQFVRPFVQGNKNDFADAQAMLARIIDEGWFKPRAVVGFWPANARGDDIVVWTNESRSEELARFHAIDGKTWNHPVLSRGRLLVRNSDEAACYDLR